MIRTRTLSATLVAGTALLALAGPATAQTDTDHVVASVNGHEITIGAVQETVALLGPQLQQMPLQMILPTVVDQLITGHLIEEAALGAGLDGDPEVVDRLAEARTAILQEVWLTRTIEERVTEDMLATAYAAYVEQNPPYDEVSARHILVETEEEARALIEELDAGADFATLAAENSTGPSAPRGGDLGFFAETDMVEPFGAAAFALDIGSHTAEPVQTQFGWHVIKVEDRRTVEPATLEEVRGQLVTSLQGEIVGQLIDELREGAEIVLFGPDGQPLDVTAGGDGQ